MSQALKQMNKYDLVNLEQLAYLLKGLSSAEFETLEIILNQKAYATIGKSLKELDQGEGIPIEKW